MTILFYLFVIAMLLLFPEDTAENARHALQLWGKSVVPTLFPYMIFSKLLCRRLHSLHLPISAMSATLGLLGGSPSGAALLAASANALTERRFLALCALTGTISPMFILGTLCTWTQQPALCKALLVCHWIGTLLCAQIVYLSAHARNQKVRTTAESQLASCNALSQSIDAIMHVGGYIILYSVIAGMIHRIFHPLFPALSPLMHALLEVSGGIHAILQNNYPEKGILICACLGFSGLSILSQNHALLCESGIHMRLLVCFALLRAALSTMAFIILTIFVPIS